MLKFKRFSKTKFMPDMKFVSGLYIILLGFLISAGTISCNKEEFYEDSNATLRFSVDTVYFDTVFTGFGTTTKALKVYNPYGQSLKISSVQLAGGTASNYRINVDGVFSSSVNNVVLRGKDSLYIFVEATIDPANQNSPLVVEDSILFFTNGNAQTVNLISWGQDVHIIQGEVLQTRTWTADKPYLIFNSMLVDSGHVLTIEAGARLHFHRNSRMYVAGTVQAMGTPDEEIIIQGARLEALYRNIPGQWEGIWLMAGSENNEFHYTQIKNAINGILVDTLTNTVNPTLLLANVRISNMTSAGIYARGSSIYAYNCEITNCGKYTVALTIGGSYEFYHCTFANYWNFSGRKDPSVVMNNYYVDIFQNVQLRTLEKAIFGNCIIYGDKSNELGFDFYPGQTGYDFLFDHCLIRLSEENIFHPSKFNAVIFNQYPEFVSLEDRDFTLDENSPAIHSGLLDYALLHPLDFFVNSRTSDEGPDLGAFERVE